MSLQQLQQLADSPQPDPRQRLRGWELLNWACYVEQGGHIAPMSILSMESEGPTTNPPIAAPTPIKL